MKFSSGTQQRGLAQHGPPLRSWGTGTLRHVARPSSFSTHVNDVGTGGSLRVRVAVAEYRHTSHGPQGNDDHGNRPQPIQRPSAAEYLATHLGVNPKHLQRLEAQQPEVLQLPPNRLVPRMQRISQLMGVPMDKVVVMVARYPGVLSSPPSLIILKAREMLHQMGLPKESIMPLLARQPEFLEVPIEKLASRCSLLASCLGVDTLTVVMALSRLPPSPLFAILGLRPTFLPVRVMELGRLLQVSVGAPAAQLPGTLLPDDPTLSEDGRIAFTPLLMREPLPGASANVPHDEWVAVRRNLRRAATAIEQQSFEAGRLPQAPGAVASLLVKCPQLLLVPMRTAAASYNALGNMLQVPPTRLLSLLQRTPWLLLRGANSLQATWSCLQAALQLPARVLATRLLQQPQLLMLSEQQVQARMSALSAALGWEQGVIRRAVRNQVQLLGASPATVAFKITALAHILGVPRAVADEMVQRQPALLTLSPPTLQRNLRGLEGVLIGPCAASMPPGPTQDQQQQEQRQDSAKQRTLRPPVTLPSRQQHQHAQCSAAPPANTVTPASAPSDNGTPRFEQGPGHQQGSGQQQGPGQQHPPPQQSPAAGIGNAERPTPLHPDVVSVAVQQPTLLTLPPRTLNGKMLVLERLFHLRTPQAQALLLRHPALLTVPRANLHFRVNELQLAFNLPLGLAVTLLTSNPPLVLQTSPFELRSCLPRALSAWQHAEGQGSHVHTSAPAGLGPEDPGEEEEAHALQVLQQLLSKGTTKQLQELLQRVELVLRQ